MSKERHDLECLKVVTDYWYEKTEDKWYEKISKKIERKLKKKWNGK